MQQITFSLFLFLGFFSLKSQEVSPFKLSFSTSSLSDKKAITFNGKTIKLTVTTKCNENTEPPFECYTNIKFSDNAILNIEISGEGYAFAVADINKDGIDEFVVLSKGGGNWRNVSVYGYEEASMTSNPFWYEPFGSFLWYPGFEGDYMCDAKIYFNKNENKVKILTTNAAEENFKCNEEITAKWSNKPIKNSEEKNNREPFSFVEIMPEYIGGEDALMQYLQNNIKYPEYAKNNKIGGTVQVEFVVNEDGTISNEKVVKGIKGGCDEEALRVIKKMPRWKPGKENGKPVSVYYTIPIVFKYQ